MNSPTNRIPPKIYELTYIRIPPKIYQLTYIRIPPKIYQLTYIRIPPKIYQLTHKHNTFETSLTYLQEGCLQNCLHRSLQVRSLIGMADLSDLYDLKYPIHSLNFYAWRFTSKVSQQKCGQI